VRVLDAVAVVLIALLLGAGAAPGVAADVSCPSAAEPEPRVVHIPVDLREARRSQAAFEQGQQPWRADPRFMAYVEIGTPLERDVQFEDMRVERETETEAVVFGKGTRCWYRVSLRRPLGARSVWTPVEIEYGRAGSER
jgi:hypothetical protein